MIRLTQQDRESIHRGVLGILASPPEIEELTSDEEAALRAVIGRGA